MNLRVSRGAIDACETDDGMEEGEKDPPTVDVAGGTLDGSSGVRSIKGLCGGSSTAGATGGVGRGVSMLLQHQ
ncbi:UNVERIFIED_CONTAM: hypothetical protein Sangu_1037300 [Sesamum angustifolium]|uniref:Uncharacterized protein n=1 Tax=Sesamum angustifolium TaxID=2727405 RepID=A0AAW2NWZ4_9LAMI